MSIHPSILALDCSTYATSVTFINTTGQKKQRIEGEQLKHSKVILSMIDACCDKKQKIDSLALAIGPGNFMSIRISLAVAQAIATVNDLPIFTISSLKLLAWQYFLTKQSNQNLTCTTAIDARRQEWYHARWQYQEATQSLQELSPPALVQPKYLTIPAKDCLIGDGFQKDKFYDAQIDSNQPVLSNTQCLENPTTTLIKLCLNNSQEGTWATAASLQPLYLHNDIADKPKSL